MSIFSRIFKIGEASANKLVDKLEKPELMLEQAIRDKQKQIVDAKKSIQSCIATERQTRRLLDVELDAKTQWEQKAQMALQAGKEELAVKALQRATEHEQKSESLQTNWQSQRTMVDELKKEITKLDEQHQEFKRNKDFIIAQSKAAQVKKDLYEAKARISSKGNRADDLMARMKAKAERTEFEAEAAKELAEDTTGDSLEKEFENMGGSSVSSDVQSKLAAMKAKLGQQTG